jgi:LysR family hydrogen peroxide-inducible transcriptional activator
MVLEDEHCFGKQALEFCFRAKAQDHQFRATSLATIISMVAGGVGVTLLPTLAVRSEVRINNLRVRRFADPEAGSDHRSGVAQEIFIYTSLA